MNFSETLLFAIKNLYDVIGSMQAEIDLIAGTIGLTDPQSSAAAAAAQKTIDRTKRDLDEIFKNIRATSDVSKVPSGEGVIDQLLAGQIVLQREYRAMSEKIAVQTKLLDSHQRFIEGLTSPGIMH
jgi:hypothetical protein